MFAFQKNQNMRKLSILILMSTAVLATQAQRKSSEKEASSGTTFSVGVEAGIPTGLIHLASSLVIGGSLQAEKHIGSDFAISLNAGYRSYQLKKFTESDGNGGTITTGGGSSNIIPVLAGVRYYFKPNFYGHAQLGAGFATESGGGTHFAYSPGIGYNISQHIDAEVKYMSITTGTSIGVNDIGIRLAYNF